MAIKRIVLKYPTPPTESYYTEDHMYVALDSGSGGYPTRSTILEAHDFKTLEEAQDYVGPFKDFKPVELLIEVKERPLV